MGIIGWLFREIAGQLDNPRYKRPWRRPGEIGCVYISPDWLQSTRFVGEPNEIGRGSVIVPLSERCSSAGLGRVAGDFRIDTGVVERASENRHADRAQPDAARFSPVVVVSLTVGYSSDDEPDDENR